MRCRFPTALLAALAALWGLGGTPLARSAQADEASLPQPYEGRRLGDPGERKSGGADPPSDATGWHTRIEARLDRLAERANAAPAPASPLDSPDSTTAPLQAELARLTAAASQHSTIGVAVRRLSDGAPVFEYQANLELNPASNHKLLTAVAAVELLGPDYRFGTDVLLADDALILRGSGDPSLQVENLESLASRTATSGVDLSSIRRIVADDSAFTARRFGPGYETTGPGWSYLAPSGALSLQFNTVTVSARASESGATRVTVDPPCPYLWVEDHTWAAEHTQVSVTTSERDGHTVVDVRGAVAPGSPARARRRIVDPAQFAASTFAMALAARAGIAPLPVERGVAPSSALPIATHRSAPLPQVLSAALVFSNNFTSEQVLRALGRHDSGEAGDWVNGRAALRRFWSAIGRPDHELTFENASGYSRRGRLTADAILALLAMTQAPDRPSHTLAAILPASGKHGTMRHRLRGTRGRVHAKTGTLQGASALSGWVTSRDGERGLGFSILVNGTLPSHASRRLQDRLVMAMVEHLH